MKLSLKTPVSELRMVGPSYVRKLEKLEILTVSDLLYHRPHRYLDYSNRAKIAGLRPGEITTVSGTIVESKNVYTRTRKAIQKLKLEDDTGVLEATWFNQPYLTGSLVVGARVNLSGEVNKTGLRLEMLSPEYELARKDGAKPIHTGRLVPVYPETQGVSSKWLRSRIAPLIELILPDLPDWLPDSIREKELLIRLNTAIRDVHFPESLREVEQSVKRLSFDEMFLLQLTTLIRKASWNKQKVTRPLLLSIQENHRFRKSLPFALTAAQIRTMHEILEDLRRTKPMNRILIGDVGSGKTVVAALAMYAAFRSHAKSVIMAPTEILATQHEKTLRSLLQPLGISLAFCTASRKENLNSFDVLIGTHAVLFKRVKSEKYGLVVVDEQHRFGVAQRALLIKKGIAPHTLTMTATPIPRTVALTLYGDLDLSIIDEMPPGRIRVKTWVISPQKRQAAYEWIKKRIAAGEQAFIVCPLIEESVHESMTQVKAASEEYEKLKKTIFPDFSLALLHGKMKASQKNETLERFRKGKTDILVTTPVVEVGIDIPNATVMVVEGAERFGLSQLHQLRGRVGRGEKQSFCLLFATKPRAGRTRLKAMESAKNGGELAELDLKLRGPGEIFGLRQHGFSQMKFAQLTDTRLIAKTRDQARKLLTEDPNLLRHPLLADMVSSLEKPVEPN
ncbi:MAG: ATP-dependent DNA helicase RecG [Candidatus Chisholmbacteria bacterium RIFCSPLOWO2_01_FULL_49_14]|uniref:Probable DNA 3'-5' helicase RecG n=1 Tax=Candidatus Chisholmbacteria bacterium RIFCSPLOWO2_01_FULL_49_14 TaxID=1797593 RepID=A0A1G1W3F4_9BACT|nr:MAG: ATP-dependent DNA helicase RecG [Candidatus Chisholmbacteria bacterium RIFCSPLOWO2_01_FULL_49_14]